MIAVTLRRSDFLGGLKAALDSGTGYAAVKIGFSEQSWLAAQSMMASATTQARRRAIETAANWHGRIQGGIFPSGTPDLLAFAEFFGSHLGDLDFVGLPGGPLESDIVDRHGLFATVGDFEALEPDRSVPHDESNCYLPWFEGKRVLLVSSCADLLRRRATKEIFESVWKNTGKPWWNPASVTAVEFPSTYDPATKDTFARSIDLVEAVWSRINVGSFDVALLGAGYLGVPLSARIRRAGRIAVSLGGHLQVLFGVLGRRWEDDAEFRSSYINDSWIPMPDAYRPRTDSPLPDGGAYW